jgi:hypothetical protein
MTAFHVALFIAVLVPKTNSDQVSEPYTTPDTFECQHGFHSYGH